MRNLRITFRYNNREYVLNYPIPKIDEDSTDEEKSARAKHVDDPNKVSCIMIVTMSLDLQNKFKNTWAYEMNFKLAKHFSKEKDKNDLKLSKP